jgi:hypothetical protein
LGLSDDLIAYIAGARSLMQGDGYRSWLASSQPVTIFRQDFVSPGHDRFFVGLTRCGVRLLNGLLFANVI